MARQRINFWMTNWPWKHRCWAPAVLVLLLGALSALAQRAPVGSGKNAAKGKPAAEPAAKSVEALTTTALKSIVVVTHFGRDGKEDGVGAGFIVSADGLIATSLHVDTPAERSESPLMYLLLEEQQKMASAAGSVPAFLRA